MLAYEVVVLALLGLMLIDFLNTDLIYHFVHHDAYVHWRWSLKLAEATVAL